MSTILLAGGCPTNTAVRVLIQHLTELGHRVVRDPSSRWDCTIRWGQSYGGDKPVLNANVNHFNKMQALVEFKRHRILAPIVLRGDEVSRGDLPVLARKTQHQQGKDIIICHTMRDVEHVFDFGTHDFFTPHIPTATEYRVWVFKHHALAVYEKVFKGERGHEGLIRNRRFGFKFVLQDGLENELELAEPSVAAVKALYMDFGAADVLLGKDGRYYVLEVNSMHHIDSVERASGIRLSRAISRWVNSL